MRTTYCIRDTRQPQPRCGQFDVDDWYRYDAHYVLRSTSVDVTRSDLRDCGDVRKLPCVGGVDGCDFLDQTTQADLVVNSTNKRHVVIYSMSFFVFLVLQ